VIPGHWGALIQEQRVRDKGFLTVIQWMGKEALLWSDNKPGGGRSQREKWGWLREGGDSCVC